jgi:Domain of unknown function (DUF4129)
VPRPADRLPRGPAGTAAGPSAEPSSGGFAAATSEPQHPATLDRRHPGTLDRRHPGTLDRRHPGTLDRRHRGTSGRWYPGAVAAAWMGLGPGSGQGQGELRVPEWEPEQVREVAREVLSRPEFRPPERSLIERLFDWVLEMIGRLLAALGGTGAGGIVGLILLALVLVGVGVLVARFSRGLTPSPEVAAAVAGGRRRSGAEWRAEAETQERAGAWREAVRSRYRALVADLASRGLVEEVPGRTAGEYRRDLGRALPAAATDFAGATELFEVAWYGRADTGPGEAAHLRDLSDRVLARAGT